MLLCSRVRVPWMLSGKWVKNESAVAQSETSQRRVSCLQILAIRLTCDAILNFKDWEMLDQTRVTWNRWLFHAVSVTLSWVTISLFFLGPFLFLALSIYHFIMCSLFLYMFLFFLSFINQIVKICNSIVFGNDSYIHRYLLGVLLCAILYSWTREPWCLALWAHSVKGETGEKIRWLCCSMKSVWGEEHKKAI